MVSPILAKFLNKNDLIINEVVLNKAQREGQVIYGAKAYNYQSPTHLRKTTYDYDVLTKKPKRSAKEVVKELNRRLGEEVKLSKGSHKGTYRVKVSGQVVADYTQLRKKPKTKKIWGIEARDLKSIKRNVQRLIKNPKSEYRREKDLDTFNKIQEIERIDKAFDF